MKTANSFLSSLSNYLVEYFDQQLDQVVVILPNNRAKLFLAEHLQSDIQSTQWLPELMSSKELMEQISGLKIAEELYLLTHLFKAWKEESPDIDSFHEFMQQGSTLLRDFVDIDQQLADTKKLFYGLNEIRSMENWQPDSARSEMQQRYLDFCAKLEPIYQNFRQNLLDNGMAHAGLAERVAFEKLTSEPQTGEKKFMLIAGFNALTKAENAVFDLLSQWHDVRYMWDYDKYYLENLSHEAGSFSRSNLRNLKDRSLGELSDHFKDIPKDVRIYRCTTSIEQAFVANHLVAALAGEEKTDQTAVVLAEESLLLPVLQHLPAKVKDVNVTMGYPLKHSPFHALFESVIRLYFNRMISGKSTGNGFYHRDIMRLLLNDALVKYCTKEERLSQEKLLNDMLIQGRIHVPATDLTASFFQSTSIQHLEFSDKADVALVIRQLKAIIEELDFRLKKVDSLSNKMSREFLLHHMEVVLQTEKIQQQLNNWMDIRSFYRIWQQNVRGSKVQFTGEPLMGLQVMGLLETRNLDFENVIVLSVNEGVLPSSRSYGSLLPNDLKRAFGMMVHHEREAVFSHHFYRLLQRAKNIHLIYYTQSNELGSTESSRFIKQLELELPKYSESNLIREIPVEIPFQPPATEGRKILQSEEIQSVLLKRFESGLSPTAISNYLTCPLDFYYTYVVGLREREEMTDQLEADILGSALHECLENLYQPFVGKLLKSSDVEKMMSTYEDLLKSCFEKYIRMPYLMEGKNLLTFHMANRFLKQFLQTEYKRCKKSLIEIIGLEQKVERMIQLSFKGQQLEVKIKGIIDRMERENGVLQIIDYKTGNVVPHELTLKSVEELIEGNKNKALQLMIYSWISAEKNSENQTSRALIYSLRTYNQGYLPVQIDKRNLIGHEDHQLLEYNIQAILRGMLERSEFSHNAEAKYCTYC